MTTRRVEISEPLVREALRVAFEEHYASLLRLCMGLSGNRDVAEDIVQETFVRVADRIAGLEADEVGPYLRKVVVNLWKNRLRRLAVEMRHRALRPSYASGEGGMETRDALWRALRRLSERQRACLVLRFYEDLGEREVAEVLGCSVGAVKSHTSRGLQKLRKELGHEDRGAGQGRPIRRPR